jgi:hypothetical protein
MKFINDDVVIDLPISSCRRTDKYKQEKRWKHPNLGTSFTLNTPASTISTRNFLQPHFFILLINDHICYSQSYIIAERNVKFLLGFQFKRGNRTPPNSLCMILLGNEHGSQRNTFSHGKQTTLTNLSICVRVRSLVRVCIVFWKF